MCTVTVQYLPDGLIVRFNRDELHTRPDEAPLAVWDGPRHRFVAARDGERPSTWLAANDAGLVLALLNDYSVDWRPAAPRASRGALVWRLAGTADGVEAINALIPPGDELVHMGAFTLLALTPAASAVLRWDGERLTVGREVPTMVSSSSWRPRETVAARTARFAALGPAPTGEVLEAYHRDHLPAAGAESVRMCRTDACTRSVSRVEVSAARVTFRWEPLAWPGRPSPALPPRVEALGRRG